MTVSIFAQGQNVDERLRFNFHWARSLRRERERVVPFFGAGSSKDYGYPLWKALLTDLTQSYLSATAKQICPRALNQIFSDIDNGHLVKAADELEVIASDLNKWVSEMFHNIRAIQGPITEKILDC